MCVFGGGGIPRDNSAEIARQQEAARMARITEGEGKIASAFEPFNDQYYDTVANDYTGYYEPELRDQYVGARKKLTYDLGRTGGLNTSSGAERLADLFEEYGKQRTQLADKSRSYSNEARQRVEGSRSDLLSQNRGSADPSSIAAQAASQYGILSAPPAYSPLGDVFSTFLNQAGNATAMQFKGFPGWGIPLPNSKPIGSTGTGSGRIVS